MKKIKFLSMVLAVVMILSVLPLAQVFATEPATTGTAHVLHVKSTGHDTNNNGLTEAAPVKTVTGAIKKAEALTIAAGDTVTIKVYGTVTEGTGQAIFSSYPTTAAARAPIAVPVEIVGATNDATVAFNTQAATGTSSSSTRRYFGSHTLIFKDLKFTVAGDLNKMMYLSAGTGNVTFDNVSFDSTVTKWRIFADAMVGNTWKNTATARGADMDNKHTFNTSITFKNGDYTNLDEVAAIASCATGSSPSNYDTKVPGAYNSSTWTTYPCEINTKVIIENGAKMGTVYGINWHSFAKTGTVEVKAGAIVNKLIAVGDDCDIASENAITIDVAEGATVTNYTKLEGTNTFAGTVTDGTETPPPGGEGEGGQTPPPATGTTYNFYVGATGNDSNDGKTEATAFATLLKAIKAAEALTLTANDKVIINVAGAVNEGSGVLQNVLSSYSSKAAATPIAVPVEIVGTTADAAVNFVTATGGTSSSSSRRYAGSHNLIFKNLKITASGDYAEVFYLSVGTGSFTFDNVKFDSTNTKWRIYADTMVSNTWKETAAARGATLENKVTFNTSITFKNGDYTNLDEVAALAACQTASDDYTKKAATPSYTATNHVNAYDTFPCVVNTKVVVENGAKMGTVYGISWLSFGSTGTVEVKAGAQVNTLYGACAPFEIYTENAIYLDVAEGATVTNLIQKSEGLSFAGTVQLGSAPAGGETPGGEGGQTPPPGEETPKLPKATYTFYLGGEGASDSNDGLSANKPYKTALKVIKALEAMTFKKDETVLVVINGAVQENGSNPGQHFLCSSEKVKPITAPITFYGADENASFAFVCTTEGHSSTRRYGGPHNITFQNLKIKSVGEATILHISAGLGQYTFDNCSFQTGIKWRFYADCMVGNRVKNYAAAMGGTVDKPITINTCITFKNGDYTNLEEVAAIGSPAIADGEKNTNGGTPSFSSSTYSSYPCVYNTKVVIGEGAKMSKVYGIAWPGWAATGTVEVQKGAEVASLQGTCDGLNITSTNTVYINVQEGAKVNYKALGANAKFAGTIVKGAPATGDVTMIALPVSFAVLSLAGVVILKKKYFA